VRHGKIIPWDDDVDVFLNKKDEEKFVSALRKYLEQKPGLKMTLWNSEHGYKLKSTTMKGVGTDIFCYAEENGVFLLDRPVSRACWPRDFFLVDETERVVLQRFGPTFYWIPNDPMRYLFQVYGKDCMKVAKLDMCHLENKPHVNRGVPVPLDKVQCV
jgi:hypothetical protein